MIHADHALARRLENLVCAEYRLAEVGNALLPESCPQRNVKRLAFRIVYTHMEYTEPRT